MIVLALGAAACGETTVKQEADKPAAKAEQPAEDVTKAYEAVEEVDAEQAAPQVANVGEPSRSRPSSPRPS